MKSSKEKNSKIFHLSFGSCNGCDIEVTACRLFGYIFSNKVEDSDVILLTGLFDERSRDETLKSLDIRRMSAKKLVLVGSCCISKGIFDGCKDDLLEMNGWFKADAYVFGCPPSPKEIDLGIKLAGRE